MSDPRRAIPSVEKLLSAQPMQALLATESRNRVIAVLREIQDEVRHAGAPPLEPEWYARETAARLHQLQARSLRRVINATGVVLHTNLGRAPLCDAAIAAIADAARDYSNLEYDVVAGERGSRYEHCTRLLCELTGAEAALVVNNNAAALVLTLNTFAEHCYAVVSRGELVEIGGSFRIPEIMERSGAKLREVGATNRTHLQDYANAIDADVGALLKVHRSNFEMSGYVSEVPARELADLARQHRVAFIHDLGSGLLEDLSDVGLTGEPTARAAVAAVRDGVVTMSGDKLLGGPQAGIILASSKHIERMRANPLCRALRVDKLTLAALEATLRVYAGGRARQEIPALRMLCMTAEALHERAHHLRAALERSGVAATIRAESSAVGGGAFPDAQLATYVVAITPPDSASHMDARLRAFDPPVISRIIDQQIAIDLRTVHDSNEPLLLDAIVNAAHA
ncbi:MAG TPA: L-seryl-tRNA(Sec) selenium transferase [Longimicrobiales bacterium]